MKLRRMNLARRYLAALRAHVHAKRPLGIHRAQNLGKHALAQGLATLDLAAIHQQAWLALTTSRDFKAEKKFL